MKRKRYPKEFKDQLIQETVETGNVVQVAKRHEISPKTLYRWISRSKHKAWEHTSSGAKKTAVYVPSHQEFKQLEKENNQLKKLLGEKDLEIAILRDLIKKKNPGFHTE
ncbi:transposase [Desulforamulus hydrothermalis]|uniref:Putative transposase component CP4-6 prophage n=1 Tax=Desulforamulus hydrothermalis Lam5 = DSM 18033 TaxID=1121428 RepID=K8DYI2_9FIRM|nr:transposase [Desulforamulus hydrothermalis]CCO07869.1 putative transposase component; CP4-6 prophage [Desulforamulus hydrothermalis Lam5 = DSM 18033]SHH28035.1 Transposase and inactivated derivatives [Desulforamulus hydrothermalis Lam5 = DSM 18033]